MHARNGDVHRCGATMSGRPRVRALVPLFVVSDLQRALEFYEQKLGFTEPSVWGEPPCFAMLYRDGFELMLGLAEDPTLVQPNGPHGVWDLYLRVTAVEAEIAALTAAGVKLDHGPIDKFYDMREIEIVDPDGYRICLAENISATAVRDTEVWDSVLDIGAAKLRLVLKLATVKGALVARVDSVDQGAMNLAVDRVELDSNRLRFEMSAIGAKYQGTLSADGKEIIGQWSQRSSVWPLVWRRAD
jgi:catechol 2,3-dioxygenase-like lactoylglutathione lyase family enzyme